MDSPVVWIKTHKGIAIGGATVILVIGFIAYRRHSAANAAASGQANPDSGALVDPGAGLTGSGQYLVPYSGSGLGSGNLIAALQRLKAPAVGTTPGATNNISWETQAVAWLTGTGGYNALEAQGALQAYLAGKPLSLRQARDVSAAVKQLGLPPAGSPPPKLTPGATAWLKKHRKPAGPPPAQGPVHHPVLNKNQRDGLLKWLQHQGQLGHGPFAHNPLLIAPVA